MYHRQLKNVSEQQSDHLVRGHFQEYRDEIQDLFYFIRNPSKVCAFFPHRHGWNTCRYRWVRLIFVTLRGCSGWDLFDLPSSGPEEKRGKDNADCLGGYEAEEYGWNITKSTFNKQTKKSLRHLRILSIWFGHNFRLANLRIWDKGHLRLGEPYTIQRSKGAWNWGKVLSNPAVGRTQGIREIYWEILQS